MEQQGGGPRARYRQQVRDEIQVRAWGQIEQAGASALSLKAIATQMGMTAPALYRYFGSRDELLTVLILDAYEELASIVETVAVERVSPRQQLTDIAGVLRHWAVSNPQRYLLLYGTPVPGYHAPPEATALAGRIFAPVLAGFTGLLLRDAPHAVTDDTAALRLGLTFWTRLHGVLSLELAGHFAGMDVDPAAHYQDELRTVIELG